MSKATLISSFVSSIIFAFLLWKNQALEKELEWHAEKIEVFDRRFAAMLETSKLQNTAISRLDDADVEQAERSRQLLRLIEFQGQMVDASLEQSGLRNDLLGLRLSIYTRALVDHKEELDLLRLRIQTLEAMAEIASLEDALNTPPDPAELPTP